VGLHRADYHADRVTWITWKDPKLAKPNFHNPGSFGVVRMFSLKK